MIDERTGAFYLKGLPRAEGQFQRGGFSPLAVDDEGTKDDDEKDDEEKS